MSYNIIEEYLNFLKKSYLNFFKIIFKNKYNKELSLPFIEKYLNVRYCNETNYFNEKDLIKRVNKELIDLLNKMATEDNIDYLKNVIAIFAYLVYFDDICYITQDMELIDSLVSDDIIKIDDKKALRQEIKTWYINFKKSKELFFDTLSTKDFNLIEKRLYRKLFYLILEHDVKISNLYSEYAVDKAYNSGTINEDKLFITYILAQLQVLNNAINLDFTKHYMVPFASSLFTKEKKCARVFSSLDNPLAKKFISIRITYQDYKKNKSYINDLINEGYSFGLELDYKYTGNVTELLLFPYILVYEDSEEYEMLIREKDHLKSKIVKL